MFEKKDKFAHKNFPLKRLIFSISGRFDMVLLINTITAWYEPPRARHQLTYALAKSHNVIFVARNEIGKKGIKIEKLNERITVITPFYPLGYKYRYRLPIINENYQRWLFSELNKLFTGITVINFDFTAHLLNSFFKKVIYYCNDEYIGNSKYPNWLTNQYHRYCENRVIRNAIFNVTTSDYLTLKFKAISTKTHQILLGSDQVDLPAGYYGFTEEKCDRIRLGLMGVINRKQISLDMINELADDPGFELTIIGPVEDKFSRGIRNKDRIRFTGELKGNPLLGELMKIDVGLALYNTDRVNPGATPNKLWQYLAVGKPVIISPLPNLKDWIFPVDSVYIYKHKNEIKRLIHIAYSRNTINLSKDRINFSKQHTWDSRAKDFIQLMNQYHI